MDTEDDPDTGLKHKSRKKRFKLGAFRDVLRKAVTNTTEDLYRLLEESDITNMHDLFNRQDGRRMNREELKDALMKVARIEYRSDVFETMFLRMNSACNGSVTWNEFISHLILGFEQNEVSTEYRTLEAPIPIPPNLIKSNHRHTINRITFYPTVKPDRTSTWHDGSIMTCSHDGVINYWSLDMTLERTVQSTCPTLKVQPTWVTDMVVLPDVSVICTSSSERDLRFYDTSARKFQLRVMMTTLEFAVTTMYYKFYQDPEQESELIMGDMAGGIRIIYINSIARGPFKSQPGIPLLSVRWEKVIKGYVPNFRAIHFPNCHTDFVRQVSYYPTLHCFVSCAQCPKAGLLMQDTNHNTYTYNIVAGVWCFALEESVHIVATGSPDCLVRIWNPFVPHRPTCTFYGHHMGIVQLVFQDEGKRLYSLSKDKCIKVWDIGLQSCLQTYLDLPSKLGERSDLTTLYNPESRQWIIGSTMIGIIPLSPEQSGEHTDGNTHFSGVSVVLYNKLFKVIVTCGLDSYIIVWNPWDGRRLLVIKEAHTRMQHGEIMSVEITAATFDPGFQRLLTGAHDGTLKVWSFNTGTCLRNLSIAGSCEVQSVVWVKNRILAMGWNKRVTEFADTGDSLGPEGAFSKNWDLRHSEDISSTAVREPETIATSSYAGELILWRLETGQPYRRFIVSNPTKRIKIQYDIDKKEKHKEDQVRTSNPKKGIRTSRLSTRTSADAAAHRSSITKDAPKLSYHRRSRSTSQGGPGRTRGSTMTQSQRRVSTISMPEELFSLRRLAVHCMIFLCSRKSEQPKVGTLLVALENGVIQVWNHNIFGGYITSFNAVHKAGDYVISMATDDANEFLFVGTTAGYIKTWLMKNYCVLPEDIVHICMPIYRLMFPFMWGDRFVGRARRIAKLQPEPLLLSSYKGHFMPVSGLFYIDDCQIIVSCSADFSARMWTLGGRYLQTLGTFKPWKILDDKKTVPEDYEFTIPPDIERVASSTTLRVLSGGSFPKRLTFKQLQKQAQKDLVHIDHTKIYGQRLQDPILGKHYNIPERTIKPKIIKFDTTFPYIPVYTHLIMPQTVHIERVKTPPGRTRVNKGKKTDKKTDKKP